MLEMLYTFKKWNNSPGILAPLALPVFQAWGKVGMGQKLSGFELEPIEEDADQILSSGNNP